ncbi:alpha-L-glutamate ligase [Bacillus aquiflavi]|uniref:Alpha-L-glutamate ligase n=1 Tax=Bacillus aquiflavi TaxID=2672567 RepID=A0A6B3VSJ9_9BACI|nr:alpha-L-glutamate ligase [Bacillus aquiflavi]MBA4536582.1 alpha-L-glutamate ligase [Bacillus aquiflavi]NEY80949.1 alpha-L-glutamate ligase [Bacillus aquiflavi]UAC49663.1 alpha-L-glutamate ligase [Bacillus aquiflavi]
MTGKIYVIHENDEWTIHLTKRLDELALPYEEWHLNEGILDLTVSPPEGIFYSRMSASSHTRGHPFAPELTEAVIAWLEYYDRKIINGSRALRLEVSKVNQYTALEAAGIRTPNTIAAVGKEQIIRAAKRLDAASFITKHNRAGKGLGVQLFHSIDALNEYVKSPRFELSIDGITLIQEYIQAPEPYITRCEFVGGKFVYAVQVDTSEGFELCPAEACQIEDLFCPVGEKLPTKKPKFKIIEDFQEPIIEKYESFLKQNDIQIAGIEFIRNDRGELYTYDVNTNTNYNADAEFAVKKFGMLEVAKFLEQQLKTLTSTVKTNYSYK